MKSNGANMGSLNKNIAAKKAAGAAADAEKLEATFITGRGFLEEARWRR
jgi:hypothetical protein